MVPHCCQLIFQLSQARTERGADQRLQENHDENGKRKIDFVHPRHRRDAHEPRICTEAVSSAIAGDDTVSGPHGPVPQWGDPNRKCIKPIRPGPRLLFWELTTQARLQIGSAQKGPGGPRAFSLVVRLSAWMPRAERGRRPCLRVFDSSGIQHCSAFLQQRVPAFIGPATDKELLAMLRPRPDRC
jgi:hypothetical protein